MVSDTGTGQRWGGRERGRDPPRSPLLGFPTHGTASRSFGFPGILCRVCIRLRGERNGYLPHGYCTIERQNNGTSACACSTVFAIIRCQQRIRKDYRSCRHGRAVHAKAVTSCVGRGRPTEHPFHVARHAGTHRPHGSYGRRT